MRFFKFLFNTLFLMFIFCSLALAASTSEEVLGEGINPNQPISIGEIIYEKGVAYTIRDGLAMGYVIFSNKYTYAGVDNNIIKVNYISYSKNSSSYSNSGEPEEENTAVLSLPLNSKKQALLKVKSVKRGESDTELTITIVDDFYRIKVVTN